MEDIAGLDNQRRIKLGLLLLGSFILAYIGAKFLHEICHAGAAVIMGGHAGRIIIHPFNWSYSYSSSQYPIFHTAAGAIGSSLIALLLYIFLIRRAKPLLFPLLLLGPASLFENGGYWLIDTILGSNGDACRLIDMGIPIAAIFCTSAVLLLLGIVLTIHLTRAIGITGEPFRNRFIILAIGIFPYALAELLWNWFYARHEFGLWLTYGLLALGITILLTIILGYFSSRKDIRIFSPTWPIIAGINIAAMGLIVALLWMDSASREASSRNFQSRFKSSTTRPDNAPDILVPHKLAVEPTYIIAMPVKGSENGEIYNLSYLLPENTDPNEVLDYLTALHKKQGYVALAYSLDDPNEFHNSAWKEENLRFGLKTFHSKSCLQEWLRLMPEPSLSVFAISVTPFKNSFTSIHVLATHAVSLEKILKYDEVHPGIFDPNQIEQLREKTQTD